MTAVQSVDYERFLSHLRTLLNFSLSERGGVELATEVVPTISHPVYVRRLCQEDRLPHRKIGGRYLFTRLELETWMAEGAPTPASEWAAEFRQRYCIDTIMESEAA